MNRFKEGNFCYFQNMTMMTTPEDFLSSDELLLIVTPVLGGLGFLFLSLVILYFMATAVKSRRSLHGTYSPQKQEIQAPRFEMMDLMLKHPPQERLI